MVDNGDGTFSLDPAGGQTVALVLTNTADAEPQFGALTVTKAIAADSEAAPKDVVYGFEVVCTGATYAGEAAAGESFTVEGIPAGAECAVTETQAHGAAAIAYSAESVTIVAGETAAVTVTNTFSAPPVSSVPPTELPLTSLATTGGDSAGALFAAGGAVLC